MSEITRENVIADMQTAAERMGLDLEDLQEMINEVLEDCSGKAHKLKDAIIGNDFSSVKSIAHDIKGSTANYGLKSVSEIAYQIEQNNESSTSASADELIKQFETFSTLNLDKP